MMKRFIAPLLAFSLWVGIVHAEPEAPVAAFAERLSEVMSVLKTRGVSDANMDEAEQIALRSLIEKADKGALLLNAEALAEHKERQQGIVYSVGLTLVSTGGYPTITAVEDGTPAAEAGFMAGDIVEALNGEDLKKVPPGGLTKMIHGPREETVHFDIRGTNDATRDIEVRRNLKQLDAIAAHEILPLSLGYLKLNGVYAHSAARVIAQLRTWYEEDLSGFIIDLRHASGTDIESVIAIAEHYAVSGTMLFAYRSKDDQDLAVYNAGDSDILGVPTMVLIDDETSGAAELLAAVLGNSAQGAMLIGRVSGADPLIRDYIDLSTGEALYLATRRVVTADGTVYDGQEGVEPDVRVRADAKGSTYELQLGADKKEITDEDREHKALHDRVKSDETLRRAADILLGLKALNIRGRAISPSSTP